MASSKIYLLAIKLSDKIPFSNMITAWNIYVARKNEHRTNKAHKYPQINCIDYNNR